MMTVKLTDIFIHDPKLQLVTKSTLMTMEIKAEFLLSLATYLGLTYNMWDTEGNLCFAQNQDLRPGYRSVLTRKDIKDHLNRTLKDRTYDLVGERVTFPRSMLL